MHLQTLFWLIAISDYTIEDCVMFLYRCITMLRYFVTCSWAAILRTCGIKTQSCDMLLVYPDAGIKSHNNTVT